MMRSMVAWVLLCVVGAGCCSPASPAPHTQSLRSADARLHVFTREQGALADDDVRSLFVDSSSRLWVGTATGVSMLVEDEWSWRHIKSLDQVIAFFSRDRGPLAITEGPEGQIYFGGQFGVHVFEAGEWRDLRPNCPVRADLLLCDRHGKLWAGERGADQLWWLSANKWEVVLERIAVPPGPKIAGSKLHRGPYGGDYGVGLHEVVEDASGTIWVGARWGPYQRSTWNPETMPRRSEGPKWTRSLPRYPYEGGSDTTKGAAPYAPLYVFDGRAWHSPKTTLRMVKPSVKHDGIIALMSENGFVDSVTLVPLAESHGREPSTPVLLAVWGSNGRRWSVTPNGLFLCSDGLSREVTMTECDWSSFASLLVAGITCGVEDDRGHLWLGSAGAGLLRFRERR